MSTTLHPLAVRRTYAGAFAALCLLGAAPAALALDQPHALALDSAGNLYVADSGSVEQGRPGDISIYSVKVAASGVTATLKGMITANIQHPYSVAVSPFGTIYAGNLTTNSTTVYSPSLAQTGSIPFYAQSMFVDGNADLFALDTSGNVHVYLDNLTAAGSLPTGILPAVINPWGSNVAVWGTSGRVVTANMGETAVGGAAFNGSFLYGTVPPSGIAQDAHHQQYALYGTTGTVTVFTADFTKVVTTFAAYGTAIAIDTTRSLIYTAVPTSNAIFVYSLKAPYKYLGQFL